LLHQEERRADVDSVHAVELFYRLVFDGGGRGDAGIGDEDIEPIAGKSADFRRKFPGAVGGAEVGTDSFGVSTGRADLGDERFCLLAGVAVVNDDSGAGSGERPGGGRPMPRDAPVTSAVLLTRSGMIVVLFGMRLV
jgi:hypothetical protein